MNEEKRKAGRPRAGFDYRIQTNVDNNTRTGLEAEAKETDTSIYMLVRNILKERYA